MMIKIREKEREKKKILLMLRTLSYSPIFSFISLMVNVK